MASISESLSPERAQQGSVDTEFGRLVETLQREEPELYDHVNLVLHLNAELARSDLPANRLDYLNDERREIVEQLLARPEEAILVEVDLLARRYKGRSSTGVDHTGMRSTQFVTRDPERMKADLHFRLLEFPKGHSRIRIEVPLRGGLYDETAEPYFIELDSKEGLSIEQRIYERGEYRYKPVAIDSEKGKERLWRFFTYSITATDLLDNRPPEEQQAADQQARRMLHDKLVRS